MLVNNLFSLQVFESSFYLYNTGLGKNLYIEGEKKTQRKVKN